MSSSPQYLEFGHLRIPLEDIASATDNFADENLIGIGAFRTVYKGYKGQLLRSGQLINIAAQRLDRMFAKGDHEFWREISMLSRLNHKNIVSMVGYCDEHGEKIVVNKYEVNGSLDKYLSDPTLTWMQRLHICVGAVRALSYIHYDTGRSYGVIHRNIKSSKILLDENREAKVCGFGLSIPYVANPRHRVVLSDPVGTIGYVDPIYMQTSSVTHKSDVYSFGVVLFEVLCGRMAMVREDDGRYKSLAPMAKEHYVGGKLDEIIDPDLRKQMDPQTSLILSDTAYRCLSRERRRRPDMENVVKSLEKALEFQRRHENPEPSRTPFEGTSSNDLKGRNLEHLKIQLSDIMSATKNFAETCCIGSGAYGKVYKAELDHFDSKSLLAKEGINKDEIPKRRSSVAIKRIFSRQDDQGDQSFFAEINLLTSCKHRNIVSLLGFCHEDLERILVYEIASNGSLADYLGNTDNVTPLTWMQRINMCLDIAHGLNYLHTTMENKERIIHRDIKSDNILLFEKWEAKIADFGLSRFHPTSTIVTTNLAGTEVYLDPEYMKTGKLKKESDTYSFGVVLFEIMCGRLAYDEIYNVDNDKGLPSIVRRRFNEGTLKEMIDPKIKEETEAIIFTLHRRPNQDSLDTFFRIGYQCLAETQAKRPTMDFVIKELEKALHFQENNTDNLKISLEDIKLATENFSDKNLIGRGKRFGKVYKGEVPHANGQSIIAVKRWDRSSYHGEASFLSELEILFEYQHEKVIGLVGYCVEMGEKIIVYEYASRGSLDRHLTDDCLTWMKRLEICIDVATGLDFFHGTTDVKQEVVLHRDIKSSNILLNVDWKAKISDFGLSLVCPMNPEMDYFIDRRVGMLGYCDPLYSESGFLTKESDIYSLGVVLFEILCGRLVFENYEDRDHHLVTLVTNSMNEGRLEEMVFEGIKEQIVPESLTTYSTIAYQCLHKERKKRPTTSEVLAQLKKALQFQEDYEIWKPKLPADYKELIQMSESPEIYSRENNKDLYTMFSKGILFQKGKLWFSLGSNGERNEMVSARKFSYKNRRSRKWQSVPKSRFPKVAEMVDILNLKIQIKIKTQFLSPGVNYGVHLIFRFCGPRKSLAKRMYVNLKYKKGNENLHAYFATWREDEWMMVELCRFYNHKEHTDFEVLLESFSRCYCGSRAIYVEGIEFRAIDNVKHGEIEKSNEVQVMKSNSQSDCEDVFKRSENDEEGGKLRLVASKMQTTNDQMFFVKKVLSETFDGELLNSRPKVQFRFEGVTELLRQQVFYIKCKIKSQMLSPNTENVCYLVFKLSEKCYGLHCPVIVRDLHHWRNKDTGILYFRTPSPWNLHDTDWVPKKRKDGWMEVIVWKFHSTNVLKNDDLSLNLKLISYQGTMSGLIVRGLEFRTT